MSKMAMLMLILILCTTGCVCADARLRVRGNSMTIQGKRADILYRSSGDLDGDGRRETVFSIRGTDGIAPWGIVVAHRVGNGWSLVAFEDHRAYELRTDITNVNNDRQYEIVARGLSQDGHGICTIYTLKGGKLVSLGDLGATRLRDLDGDRIPEVLSTGWVSFGYVGDHWLTIYRWNSREYIDVSQRFPREYDAVIRDIRRVIHDLRYTRDYGSRHTPEKNPEVLADLYYYLGKAYEYRGLPDKAKIQYAIAYRLNPEIEEIRNAFRKAHGLSQ